MVGGLIDTKRQTHKKKKLELKMRLYESNYSLKGNSFDDFLVQWYFKRKMSITLP